MTEGDEISSADVVKLDKLQDYLNSESITAKLKNRQQMMMRTISNT